MDAPIEFSIFYSSILIITFLTSIFLFHNGLNILSLSKIGWILLLCIYFTPFIHLLFAFEFYGKIFSKGTCFFLPNSLLNVIALFLWFRQCKFDQNGFDNQEMNLKDYNNYSHISFFYNTSFQLLITVFFVNWIELIITLLFGANWKIFFTSWEYSNDFVYILSFLVIFWIQVALIWQKQNIYQRTFLGCCFRAILNPSSVICCVVLCLFRFYEFTEEIQEWYSYYSIHDIIFLASGIGLFWLLCYHLLYKSSIHVSKSLHIF